MKPRNFASGLAIFMTTLVGTYVGASLGESATVQPANATEIAAPTKFTGRIENITTADEFTASNGMNWSLGFSPGAWAIHTSENPTFTIGERDRGQSLEAQSEDGKPDTLVASLQNQPDSDSIGIFNTPVGMNEPGSIRPGNVYEFTVSAIPGEQLFITMIFGQSNDWFYAPARGISLFGAEGNPISGNVTAQIGLWDAGIEVDQEPGTRADQGPGQNSENIGEAEQVSVNPIVGYTADTVMRVTLTPNA